MTRTQARGLAGAGLQDTGLRLPIDTVNTDRSIPACTGEPRVVFPRSRRRQVYPRVYGGTSVLSGVDSLQRGSIPACTGEPGRRHRCFPSARVYPRVYGGTFSQLADKHEDDGLSPRVRGNRCAAPAGRAAVGSIPACTGEPEIQHGPYPRHKVYPRVYGGTYEVERETGRPKGLSPRVRGNRRRRRLQDGYRRSIPACTGEPVGYGMVLVGNGVYPRVYGGTVFAGCGGRKARGLSPRVRGNPRGAAINTLLLRSIPACTGEP